MKHEQILRTNRGVYESMAMAGDPLCQPASDDELANPLAVVDAAGWLGGSIAGKKVLCLAAGGGRQSSLYAAAGADVTVVDISGAMLELDRQVAAARGHSLRLLETNMEDLSALQPGEFDIVIHPVSSCYVPDVLKVYAEVARIIRVGGLYISQHKQPTSLQASMSRDQAGRYLMEHRYYRDSPLPPPQTVNKNSRRLREPGAIEFLHRWEQIIGGMCRSGFVIEDLVEPVHAKKDAAPGSFADRACFIAPYVRIKARRIATNQSDTQQSDSRLWLPKNE